MKKYFYLHVWALESFDSNTVLSEGNIGLCLNSWPPDDLFTIFSPYFFVTEHLKSILEYKGLTGISFHKIDRISKGANFLSNYPGSELPPFYWQVHFNGTTGLDDFAIWNDTYLVVSAKGLGCLRANHVTHAEEDEIIVPFDEYFKSPRKFFWMTENMRNYFMKMEERKLNK